MAGQYNIVYVGTRGTRGRGSSLAPVVQGSTWSPHTITVKYADGSVYSLAGKTVSGTLSRRGETFAITGDLTVTDAANGIFTWDKSAADVGTPGTFAVQFVFAQSGETDATFDAPMTVTPRTDTDTVALQSIIDGGDASTASLGTLDGGSA